MQYVYRLGLLLCSRIEVCITCHGVAYLDLKIYFTHAFIFCLVVSVFVLYGSALFLFYVTFDIN